MSDQYPSEPTCRIVTTHERLRVFGEAARLVDEAEGARIWSLASFIQVVPVGLSVSTPPGGDLAYRTDHPPIYLSVSSILSIAPAEPVLTYPEETT